MDKGYLPTEVPGGPGCSVSPAPISHLLLFPSTQGLKPMDHNGLADPYVKLHLLPGASKVRGSTPSLSANSACWVGPRLNSGCPGRCIPPMASHRSSKLMGSP